MKLCIKLECVASEVCQRNYVLNTYSQSLGNMTLSTI